MFSWDYFKKSLRKINQIPQKFIILVTGAEKPAIYIRKQ